jgi:hypothetical protein
MTYHRAKDGVAADLAVTLARPRKLLKTGRNLGGKEGLELGPGIMRSMVTLT